MTPKIVSESPDLADLIEFDRVPARLYNDPEIFELELERIYYSNWVFVAHESEVPQPGTYKTLDIGRRPIIVNRDRSGNLNALVNRCRHRGATVCDAPSGKANGFTCPYHSWSYTLDGRLRGIPYPEGYPQDFDKSKLSLQRLKVDTYGGLIFASFNHDVEPLEDFLGDAKHWIDLFMKQGAGYPIKVQGAHQFHYPANWKIQLENVTDGYHFPLVHRSWMSSVDAETAEMLSFMTNERCVTHALGNGHTVGIMVPGHVNLEEDDDNEPLQERFAPVVDELSKTLPADEVRRLVRSLHGAGFNLNIFPNLALSMGFIRLLNPLSVDKTDNVHMVLGYEGAPDVINRERMRIHEHFQGPFGFGSPDDSEAWDRVQRGAIGDPDMPIMLNRGLNREVTDENGKLTSHITDETGMRELYGRWKKVMAND